MKNNIILRKLRKLSKLFESKSKKRLKNCIAKLRKSNQMLRRENDTVRAFKHDFNNIMQVIGGFIRTDDMEKLREYYFKIMNECEDTKMSEIFRRVLKENCAIFTLLANKYKTAKEKNITMNIEIMCNLKEIKEDIYEITRILGILFDNAIEAADECKEQRNVYIQIVKNYQYNQHVIIIENNYVNKNVSIREIYQKNFSTKSTEHNSGLGLWKVKNIISKTKSLKLNTSKSNDYFKQTLTINH